MSDQQTPGEHIPAAVQLWEELFQLKAQQQQLLQDFEEHRTRVRERHETMSAQLTEVIAAAGANTQAREDFQWEIRMLHGTFRGWYQSMIDLQKLVVVLAEKLEPERIITLNPPPPLRERERGRA